MSFVATEPTDLSEPLEAELVYDAILVPPEKKKTMVGRLAGFLYRWIRRGFCFAAVVGVLGVLTGIPLAQFIVLGYLLDVAGRLASGVKLQDALPNFRLFGKLGLMCLGIFLATLPALLLVHLESVAQLVNPDSDQSMVLRVLAILSCVLSMAYLMWAWARGGKIRHYLWPQPIRFAKEAWRPQTWNTMPDQLWDATVAFEIPKLFWLGLRGFLGTLVWLIPALIIIAVSRDVGGLGVAGLIGAIAIAALSVVMLYLPMLQANFAAENNLRALFDVKRIRREFKSAPWSWALAMLLCLVVLSTPLYLLKIESIPEKVVWLPCLFFVAFGIPARIGTGLALRRARRKEPMTGWWGKFSIYSSRLIIAATVFAYIVFLFVSSQYISGAGLKAWVQQHAVLVPIPFLD